MSIDFDVAPLRPVRITWSKVAERLPHELPSSLSALLPQVPLLRLTRDQSVVDSEAELRPELIGWMDVGYPSAVGLGIFGNEAVALDEHLVLEDFGRNLSVDEQRQIALAWRDVGYHFELTSTAGRAKGDQDLMAALAITLAVLTDGVVITEDNYGAMGTGVGAFTPDEFRVAVWGADANTG